MSDIWPAQNAGKRGEAAKRATRRLSGHAAAVLSGPFRGDEALAAGLLTRNRLYGPRFQRLFPKPCVQYQVCGERGYVIARVDLAYPRAKLALEYDGSVHDDRIVRERDRLRDNDLARCGWQPIHLRKEDVLWDMPGTARYVGELLQRRTATG